MDSTVDGDPCELQQQTSISMNTLGRLYRTQADVLVIYTTARTALTINTEMLGATPSESSGPKPP